MREHHPEWWGDVDGGVWYPAGWWWQQRREWVLQNHPEWWGDDWDDQWYPAPWWWQLQPQWVIAHHPDWWGDYYEGVWYAAPWWYQYHPDLGSRCITRIGGATSTIIIIGARQDGGGRYSPDWVPSESSGLVGRLR